MCLCVYLAEGLNRSTKAAAAGTYLLLAEQLDWFNSAAGFTRIGFCTVCLSVRACVSVCVFPNQQSKCLCVNCGVLQIPQFLATSEFPEREREREAEKLKDFNL